MPRRLPLPWALLALVGALYAWNLGTPELSPTDEARSGVIVRDMVEGGRWLLPRTPDGFLCEKPPAYYGLAALATAAFGNSEGILRGVSVVMAMGALAATWALVRHFGTPRAATLALLALASNLLFLHSAREAMVDMTFTCFMTAGMAAYAAARTGRWTPWRSAGFCGVAFGLAVLAKGPLGLALPLGVIGGDLLVETRGRVLKSRRWWGPGAAAISITLLLPCVWYVPGLLRGGREFLETCLLSENFRMPLGRAEGIGVSHHKPFFYYAGRQLAALLPCLILLPALGPWWRDPASARARRFLAAWAGVGFLLFQLAANKRSYYLVPLQPAFAAALGLGFHRALESFPQNRWLVWCVRAPGFIVAFASTAGLVLLLLRPALLPYPELLEARDLRVAAFLVTGIAVGVLLLRTAGLGPGRLAAASGILALFSIAVRSGLVDEIEGSLDETRPFVREMLGKLPPGATPVVLPPIRGYGVDYYWPVPLVHDDAAARAADYVLVRRSRLPALPGRWLPMGAWTFSHDAERDLLLVRKEEP